MTHGGTQSTLICNNRLLLSATTAGLFGISSHPACQQFRQATRHRIPQTSRTLVLTVLAHSAAVTKPLPSHPSASRTNDLFHQYRLIAATVRHEPARLWGPKPKTRGREYSEHKPPGSQYQPSGRNSGQRLAGGHPTRPDSRLRLGVLSRRGYSAAAAAVGYSWGGEGLPLTSPSARRGSENRENGLRIGTAARKSGQWLENLDRS